MISPEATRVIQGRARIDYGSATSVNVFVPENIVMAGFRWMGSYKNGNGLYLSTGIGSNGSVSVNNTTDLAVETSVHTNNWYAVFAVANDADSTSTFVNMPFFRAASVASNVISLAQGGETDGDTITATTYTMATNALVGSEVLIIQENKQFSGKTTTVTANTNGSVTVANAGSMGATDFFLVAPSGYDHYCYLGSWYMDASEPRNMADALQEVSSYGIDIPSVPATGAIGTATRYPLAGLVSPLSTGYIFSLTFSLSTASTGNCAHYVWHDSSNHETYSNYVNKYSSSTETYVEASNKIMFSREQAIWLSTGGSLDANVANRAIRTLGWIEM
jgi:hypothetical protein